MSLEMQLPVRFEIVLGLTDKDIDMQVDVMGKYGWNSVGNRYYITVVNNIVVGAQLIIHWGAVRPEYRKEV
jgi:hypothetical protein